jgi:hypothetical protein
VFRGHGAGDLAVVQERARVLQMHDMSASAVVTVRIDPALLAALKRKAARDGRTVSAEIVRLVRSAVEPTVTFAKAVRSMGMFSDFEAPGLDDAAGLRHAGLRSTMRA